MRHVRKGVVLGLVPMAVDTHAHTHAHAHTRARTHTHRDRPYAAISGGNAAANHDMI